MTIKELLKKNFYRNLLLCKDIYWIGLSFIYLRERIFNLWGSGQRHENRFYTVSSLGMLSKSTKAYKCTYSID